MNESILNSIKKLLGIAETDTSFDADIIMHINSVFTILTQLGLGPSQGFMIQDAEQKWDDFLDDLYNFNSVKTLMYLRVRLFFDPPPTSFGIQAMEKQIQELEWRLNVQHEHTAWVPGSSVQVMDILMVGDDY